LPCPLSGRSRGEPLLEMSVSRRINVEIIKLRVCFPFLTELIQINDRDPANYIVIFSNDGFCMNQAGKLPIQSSPPSATPRSASQEMCKEPSFPTHYSSNIGFQSWGR
jgi:hypothetical protein